MCMKIRRKNILTLIPWAWYMLESNKQTFIAVDCEHSCSTWWPVRIVTMPAVSSSPLLWETVISWRQLSTIFHKCLWKTEEWTADIRNNAQPKCSLWNGGEGRRWGQFTRLPCPDASICPFQNFDPTLSGSECTCGEMFIRHVYCGTTSSVMGVTWTNMKNQRK